MKLVKVDATSSTNTSLKDYVKLNSIKVPCCLVADNQISGRGQRGTTWQSQAGKNLTFSVYLPGLNDIHKQTFKLSALVALALIAALEKYDIPKLSIKWPNDILSRQFKIGGILIENMFNQNRAGASVIGIGLNVNQNEFPGLPKAFSLKSMTGSTFDLEILLKDLLIEIEDIPLKFNTYSYHDVLELYYSHLFKYNKVGMYQYPDGSLMQGLLRGVDNYGRLIVEFEEDRIDSFDIKEIQIKY
ncbi:biotin--[acetyl-CoA-carboxylase] ligase [Psychroflexus gondwanensis]|jgi:BirA family biotin operon repressor/biotin-[acetyl-CoA-carboxylase] ligase|uniref:biotin--[acetyl-CoA-carboxylase] ligase n=1 Tax=Psychroflexus gondwanensis TaxID=251 RepID=UPI0011BE48F3|nr:biotin--[acetyl-CoA-carboxylase] ligase [Psychroflexus gondwanensis]TXE20784.1 biotin--[acetyl-CoA-carboxylase] ligase [Psychroflexus gondwanensis]